MNIAVFIKSTTFSGSYGGLETQNKLLCEGLVSRGHKLTIFTPRFAREKEQAIENGVKYIFVECKTAQYSSLTVSKKDSWAEKSCEVFRMTHSGEKFELIIGQSSGAAGVIKNKEEFGLPIVSISHGTKMGEFQTKIKSDSSVRGLMKSFLDLPHVLKNFFTVQREFVHGSNIVVAVSNSVKKALVDETFVEETKVRVINNGIKPLNVETVDGGRNIGKFRLLYVGQLIRSKGIGKLAKLLLADNMKDFTLDIVGSGELQEELGEISGKSEGRINLRGKLDYAEVLRMYNPARFDAFVFPTSRIEGFPMVLVEAMFGRLPVVAFNLGGVSDAVTDGETGYLVDPGKFDVFKNKLVELKNDPESARKMGVNALNKATERFTLDKMLDSYEEIFKELKA
ncbi:TPA: glycosyltransferase family 1 protein [candidate division WWE3 bacterium]|uniref:Glycosyltransferase family 1 protein n=1 Tax=candidate division WWE3 bacterium TaxID=2053526 RepID=A0A656PPP4_UNCKA|nr:group 1 glycosyl transferase [candidate division WWE3 bacterium RAAC2_WWE3_1]KKS30146.1 MAG: Glycosyl transferase group 1 [candidate division WWE3 bacterium GW2011_GWB1_42_117]KKS55195.1 MAG: Glycosyl transferase group 1 [candidate division WWE3 bacterium GW2011_GWD2_42_34]KKT05746.1 MAG: Glycosyl transferase group 1 [candidate division WWE3 bacterium GW2011_GWE2_43_18]KKT07364.1 MAG: Glycosyl transferase group 1 [candidate division WWE3 bacterium GW2011_GWF2_43_18]KKT08990.1 MAG: Glycosyl 